MRGWTAVFRQVFPIKDFSESSLLEYVDYHFEDPKYDVEECQQRSMNLCRAAEGDLAPNRVRCGR